MSSKHLNIISSHVPLSIKIKVWSYAYMDLGTLLESTTNPDEEEEFDLIPDRNTNKIAIRLTTKHHNINTFSPWNKAFRVLTELLAIKWPNLCLPLVQYSHLINEQAGKFPFSQVYAYDKHFRHQVAADLLTPWNQIDKQLWSRELHGQHPTWDKVSSQQQDNFCVCFDYNKGKCTRTQCRFPHKCSKCARPGHPATNCRRRPTPATNMTSTTMDTSQIRQARGTTTRPPQPGIGTWSFDRFSPRFPT